MIFFLFFNNFFTIKKKYFFLNKVISKKNLTLLPHKDNFNILKYFYNSNIQLFKKVLFFSFFNNAKSLHVRALTLLQSKNRHKLYYLFSSHKSPSFFRLFVNVVSKRGFYLLIVDKHVRNIFIRVFVEENTIFLMPAHLNKHNWLYTIFLQHMYCNYYFKFFFF